MNQVDMAKGVNLNESFYVRIGSYVYQCMMTFDGYKVLKAPKVDELYYVPVVDDFTLLKIGNIINDGLFLRLRKKQ